MITLKSIKEYYTVSKFETDSYLLYDPTQQGRLKHKYIGTIYAVRQKNKIVGFRVNEKVCKDIWSLKTELTNYADSLPFNIDFYNPVFKKGCFEEMVVKDYMYNLGFSSNYSEVFELEIKNHISNPTQIKIVIIGLNSSNKVKI
jgi:hypothetical protein